MMVMLVPLNGSRWGIKRYKVVCFYPVHFAMEISALVVDLPVDVGHVALVVILAVVDNDMMVRLMATLVVLVRNLSDVDGLQGDMFVLTRQLKSLNFICL